MDAGVQADLQPTAGRLVSRAAGDRSGPAEAPQTAHQDAGKEPLSRQRLFRRVVESQEAVNGSPKFIAPEGEFQHAISTGLQQEGFVALALGRGYNRDHGDGMLGFDSAERPNGLAQEPDGRRSADRRKQVVRHLDDQIKPVVATFLDEVGDAGGSSALDGGLAAAGFPKEGFDKIGEEFFAVTDEDVIRLHSSANRVAGSAFRSIRPF